MKRLILFELIVLFLATTFESDSPPGWFQQVLPRSNVLVDDIYFNDNQNGWSTSHIDPGFDTAFVFATTNGGTNWSVQFSLPIAVFNSIQFLDANTGYIAGGTGLAKVYKSINGGLNWNIIGGSIAGLGTLEDMNFINKDTGWVCDNSAFGGGLARTTNGGLNWQIQLDQTFRPSRVFFINRDTGWVGTHDINGRLFRTTNGGENWNLIYTINGAFETIFFINPSSGWIRAGTTNSIQYTTDGGFNWNNSSGDIIGGYDTKFLNDSIGFSGTFSTSKILKSTDGGKTWGYQVTPIISADNIATLQLDTSNVWAGHIMHTTDGGGQIIYTGIGINPNSGVVPSFNLKQNYPNPFNPSTNITFDVTRNSKISLKIFNMLGEEIDELIDYEKHNTGTYTFNYETDDDMPSGVYFYQITGWTENKKEIFIDTKKMILLK